MLVTESKTIGLVAVDAGYVGANMDSEAMKICDNLVQLLVVLFPRHIRVLKEMRLQQVDGSIRFSPIPGR